MGKLFLSVVIPSYDEMANLQKGVLDKVNHFLSQKQFSFEVIVVDDGSTDGSAQFVKKFCTHNQNFKLIDNPHLGKAGAVTTGVLSSKGEYVLFTDMDQATPIEEIDYLLQYFDKGYDIVIGSRKDQRKGSPWTRKIMARGMVLLRTALVGIRGISDTQCGFKAMKHEMAQKVFPQVTSNSGKVL